MYPFASPSSYPMTERLPSPKAVSSVLSSPAVTMSPWWSVIIFDELESSATKFVIPVSLFALSGSIVLGEPASSPNLDEILAHLVSRARIRPLSLSAVSSSAGDAVFETG